MEGTKTNDWKVMRMENFLYVFSIEDKDKLLSIGATLLYEDSENHVYAFKNDIQRYSLKKYKGKHITTDTLLF